MITVKAYEFKAKCLKIIDDVALSGEPVIITKNGKPMARLDPLEKKAAPKADIIGALKGWMPLGGDVLSPIDVEWHAASGKDDDVHS